MDDDVDSVMRVYDGKSKTRYLRHGGTRCFYCGSRSLEGDSVDVDAGMAWQTVRCLNCGGEWKDEYRLVDALPVRASS